MKFIETLGEKLADEVTPDLPLKHRLGTGILRLVVGGLAGAIAVWGYKKGFDLVDEDEESEEEET